MDHQRGGSHPMGNERSIRNRSMYRKPSETATGLAMGCLRPFGRTLFQEGGNSFDAVRRGA